MFHIDIAALLAQYGLYFLALGCLLEGETVLVLAGLTAHQGILPLWQVWSVAAFFGWLGDQIFFWLGRWRGDAILLRFPRWAARKPKLDAWIHRYHAPVVILVRFVYGFRAAGPVLIGHSGLNPWLFAFFNALGAVIWATLFIGLGWVFGHAAEQVLSQISHYGHFILLIGGGLILLAALGLWGWHRYRARLQRRAMNGGEG